MFNLLTCFVCDCIFISITSVSPFFPQTIEFLLKMLKKKKEVFSHMPNINQWVESRDVAKNKKNVLMDQSYLKRLLLTPIQNLTISIQRLALCPNTNYVRI